MGRCRVTACGAENLLVHVRFPAEEAPRPLWHIGDLCQPSHGNCSFFLMCLFFLPWLVLLLFLMIHNQPTISRATPITIGKYRIAACPRSLAGGRFGAQVSIASGSGSATTDRVICFHDDFPTHDAAAQFAITQGIHWAQAATRPQ